MSLLWPLSSTSGQSPLPATETTGIFSFFGDLCEPLLSSGILVDHSKIYTCVAIITITIIIII